MLFDIIPRTNLRASVMDKSILNNNDPKKLQYQRIIKNHIGRCASGQVNWMRDQKTNANAAVKIFHRSLNDPLDTVLSTARIAHLL